MVRISLRLSIALKILSKITSGSGKNSDWVRKNILQFKKEHTSIQKEKFLKLNKFNLI